MDEQIEKLLSRGLEINDLDSARRKLTQYGYYNIINSYKNPYLIIENNHKHFKSDTSFEQLFSLFVFDHNLRNAILSAMLALEEHTKALASEVLAYSFGTNEKDYLQWKNFRDRRVSHERFGLNNKKPAPAPTGTGSYLRRDTYSTRHIVSSSGQTYNQNICVSVIFVPNFRKGR